MGIHIQDGTGTGFQARVTKKHKLEVDSTQHSEEHAAAVEGDAYIAATHPTAPLLTLTANGGDMLYLRNDGDKRITIQTLVMSNDTAGGLLQWIKNPTVGTLANNNSPAPQNTNFASGKKANVTCHIWDEVGDGMTGFTGGDVVKTFWRPAGLMEATLNGTFVLLKGSAILIRLTGAAMEAEFAIRFFEEDV